MKHDFTSITQSFLLFLANVSESVTVKIPAGVADGGRIRLRGKGGEGSAGGPAGDLYARIRTRPHTFFRREDRDVFVDVPISVLEAVRGAKVEIPTLDGRVTLSVPPGTQGGTRLRLRGKGIAHPKGGTPGDLFAVGSLSVVAVSFPVDCHWNSRPTTSKKSK